MADYDKKPKTKYRPTTDIPHRESRLILRRNSEGKLEGVAVNPKRYEDLMGTRDPQRVGAYLDVSLGYRETTAADGDRPGEAFERCLKRTPCLACGSADGVVMVEVVLPLGSYRFAHACYCSPENNHITSIRSLIQQYDHRVTCVLGNWCDLSQPQYKCRQARQKDHHFICTRGLV